jgi:uncharacterized phage protein (TIGR01671 family)
MREIKFRAWDGKRMTTSGIMFNCSTGFLETPIGAQMKLMQYTGLTDKNGVEIFEGDILGGFGKGHPCKEYVSNVIFNQEKGQWYLEKSWIGGQRFLSKWNDKMKVIGNIYENPELL